jgi:hypothetical protein
MLYKVTVFHTTPDKLQAFIYSLVSRTEYWDRVSKKLFNEFDGGIIVSDEDLDEIRTVSITPEGRKLLVNPFSNNTVVTREINRLLSEASLSYTEFTLRSYLQVVSMQGLVSVDAFEYPVEDMVNED